MKSHARCDSVVIGFDLERGTEDGAIRSGHISGYQFVGLEAAAYKGKGSTRRLAVARGDLHVLGSGYALAVGVGGCFGWGSI